MDGLGMTGSSGGGEIASAYVTIGADMSGLRAAEQESRQITDRIGQMTANVSFGGTTGMSGGTSLFGSGGSQTPAFGTGGGFGGSSGSPLSGTTRIDIDTSAARQSIQSLASEVNSLSEQLRFLMNIKQQFTAEGHAPPVEIPQRIDSLRSTLRQAGNFTAPAGTIPFHAPESAFFGQYGEVQSMGLEAAEGGIAMNSRPFHAPSRAFFGQYGETQPMGLEPGETFTTPPSGFWARMRARMQGTGAATFGGGRARSPLSIYGAAYRLGIGIGSAVAIDESILLGGSIASGADIASHPDYILNDLAGPMDTLRLSGNPVVRAQAASLAEIRGSQKVIAGAESIPLLGSVVQLVDAIAGGSTSLGESEKAANRNIEVARVLGETGHRNQLVAAELTGGPVERLRKAAQQEGQPYRQLANQLPSLQARAAGEIAQQLQELRRSSPGVGAAGAYNVTASTIEQLDPELAGQISNAKQATIALSGMSTNNQQAINLASRTYEGELNLMQVHGETASLRGQATSILMARNPDSERQALVLRQKAEYQDFATEAATRYDAEKDPRKQWAIRQQTIGSRSELESNQAKERADLERQIAENVAQASAEGGEMILRAHREFYAADLAELNEYARKRREAVKGKSPEEATAAETDISRREAALAITNDFAWHQSQIVAGGQISAANFRASRNSYQASLANFNAGFAASLGETDLLSPHGLAQFGQAAQVHFAELRAMGVGHAQDLQLEGESYAAQTTVSNDLIADKPITAEADSAIARARRMVEAATPENRANAITAATAMLRAQSHNLTAQHGGETAIDMSYSQAVGSMYGSGIDLTGRIGDINNARKNLNNAENDLPNAKLTDSIDPATAKAFMDSVVSILGVIAGKTGAALFAN